MTVAIGLRPQLPLKAIAKSCVHPVVRYGTDCPNTAYRENQGEPVPNTPYANILTADC
ncbi:MAG: hypothetical protein F6K26_33850 [Moorea sp. SIO2I5]|nr:hypothetical protein [Moorena sp. SIO2I5]